MASNRPSVSQQVVQRDRRAHALRLRAEGLTYEEIATRVGYAGPSGAYKAVMRALPDIDQEAAQELRRVQLMRLDDLLAEVWPVATNGRHPRQLRAVSRALAIMHRMDVLVGIDH